ncbi:MAG: helix-turn-helix transcriptional regulator [Actinomycetota bacterium]|nr:helix-turn-helix transcriptional regulator [Actinomycetota bacterium]
MTNAARLVTDARVLSGLNQRQAAVIAGVAPSTISRIERGQLDPTVSTLDRILAACGWRSGERLVPNVDMDAVRAARRILEPELPIVANIRSASYAQRWEASGFIDTDTPVEKATGICVLAAQQARLSRRSGASNFGWRNLADVVRSLDQAGEAWALTGAFAASAYTKIANSVWPTFYVGNVARSAIAAGLRPAENGPYLTLIPFDNVTSVGLQALDNGVRLADFWQIAIDCFAGNGRMPDQAEAMIAKAFR